MCLKLLAIVTVVCLLTNATAGSGLTSLDMGDYTITKVRTARAPSQWFIVASSYQGTILAIDQKGTLLWKQELSGLMNHDLWCEGYPQRQLSPPHSHG